MVPRDDPGDPGPGGPKHPGLQSRAFRQGGPPKMSFGMQILNRKYNWKLSESDRGQLLLLVQNCEFLPCCFKGFWGKARAKILSFEGAGPGMDLLLVL